MRSVATVLICFFLLGIPFAALGDVALAVNTFCVGIKGMLPSAAMLMVVLGAVIYAAGQVMGAETRARANVWSTAALTGAVVALLIAVITPSMLSQIYYGSTTGLFCEPCPVECHVPNHCCICKREGHTGIAGGNLCVAPGHARYESCPDYDYGGYHYICHMAPNN